MSSLDLWVDWDDEGESAGWHAPISLPLHRFLEDDTYATRVSIHIQQALDNLAKEVEEIGIVRSREKEQRERLGMPMLPINGPYLWRKGKREDR